ncbi:MAG: class I SAM-dependent rRNA methyltransferase [Alphaproteobacteria bacterium]|nr:class I SAM-dependent rRNA methyltransferase [Alphaproteobacteria bacterium]
MTTDLRPDIRLLPGRHKRPLEGHPWIYSNEIEMTPAAKALPRGTVARFVSHDNRPLGVGFFDAHSLIAGRLLERDADASIDTAWLRQRITQALALRERLFAGPYYRLVHAEADGMPGTVIDRFGDVVVAQVNSAGMDKLSDALVEAIDAVLSPAAIVIRNDSALRSVEGLSEGVRIAKGAIDGPVRLEENGVTFLAHVTEGQKTGWFFDQRDHRRAVAGLAKGARVLDVYAHTGAFGLQAAAAGAAEVVLVDRSELALDLAKRAAELNGLEARCRFVQAEAFKDLERRAATNERFDIVVVDPPAFVKSKKDLVTGLRGYRKLAEMAARLVAPGGFLFAASCSHNVDPPSFLTEVTRGIGRARRSGRILRQAGAAADHPVHPMLPESAYLKGVLLQLD